MYIASVHMSCCLLVELEGGALLAVSSFVDMHCLVSGYEGIVGICLLVCCLLDCPDGVLELCAHAHLVSLLLVVSPFVNMHCLVSGYEGIAGILST